jgi:hypothetical protein
MNCCFQYKYEYKFIEDNILLYQSTSIGIQRYYIKCYFIIILTANLEKTKLTTSILTHIVLWSIES